MASYFVGVYGGGGVSRARSAAPAFTGIEQRHAREAYAIESEYLAELRVERKTLTKRLLLPSERPPNTYHHVPNTYNPHPR